MELNRTHTVGRDDDGTKKFQSMCLLMMDYSELLSVMWYDLKNNTLLGTENCSNTPTGAYDVLCQYNKLTPPHQRHATPGAVTFVQHDNTGRNMVPDNYGQSFANSRFYGCQNMGHCVVICHSYTYSTRGVTITSDLNRHGANNE